MDIETRKKVFKQLKLAERLTNAENLTDDTSGLSGNAKKIKGNASRIWGFIHPELTDDISGLSGEITCIKGRATGIVAHTSDIIDLLKKPEVFAETEKEKKPKKSWADYLPFRKKHHAPDIMPNQPKK
jgi:hypothetical protein